VDASAIVLFLIAAGCLVACAAVVIGTSVRSRNATRCAEALLRQVLTSAELDQLNTLGYLDVASRTTPGRTYRVPASQGLVTVLDDGHVTMRLCLVPSRTVAEREHVLVHKLLLEGAEAEYWRQANRVRLGCFPALRQAEAVQVWTNTSGPGVLRGR
jgi:hypothetical protein